MVPPQSSSPLPLQEARCSRRCRSRGAAIRAAKGLPLLSSVRARSPSDSAQDDLVRLDTTAAAADGQVPLLGGSLRGVLGRTRQQPPYRLWRGEDTPIPSTLTRWPRRHASFFSFSLNSRPGAVFSVSFHSPIRTNLGPRFNADQKLLSHPFSWINLNTECCLSYRVSSTGSLGQGTNRRRRAGSTRAPAAVVLNSPSGVATRGARRPLSTPIRHRRRDRRYVWPRGLCASAPRGRANLACGAVPPRGGPPPRRHNVPFRRPHWPA